MKNKSAFMASQKVNQIPDALQSNNSTASRRSSHSDVFSDAHALNPFEAPDVLSPTDHDDSRLEPSPRLPNIVQRPLSLQPSFQSRLENLHRSGSSQHYPSRNSSKSRRDASTIAVVHGPIIAADDDSVVPESTPCRVTSIGSRISIPRVESPYQGTNGPSHPYAMYSQDNGVGRTLSNATTSTSRSVPRLYTGPSQPTHIYGMYSQDTISEDDLNVQGAATPLVPLGSAARHHTYQRRHGPAREDADDFIGPEGHTEQLPPYTRYANDLPPKESPSDSDSPANARHNPFGDSQVILGANPQERTQNVPAAPVDGPPMQDTEAINDSRPEDAGGHFKESLAEKSKKRICRYLPIWLLVALILLVVVVIIGGSVGAYLHRKHHTVAQPAPPPTSATPTA